MGGNDDDTPMAAGDAGARANASAAMNIDTSNESMRRSVEDTTDTGATETQPSTLATTASSSSSQATRAPTSLGQDKSQHDDTRDAAAGKEASSRAATRTSALSTAPTQDVAERFAPGSAPHWLGTGGAVGAAAGTGAAARAGSHANTADDGAKQEAKSSGEDGQSEHKEQQDQEQDAASSGATAGADAAPPQSSGLSKQVISSLPRNLPVKRYDGEALTRADLQHNLLARIFADNGRVFRNPRPGPTGPPNSSTWKTAIPAYPPGLGRGSSRPSDETEEEYEKYDKERKAFEDAPFEEAPEGDAIEAEDSRDASGSANASSGVPATLRAKADPLPKPGNDMLTFKELFIEELLHSAKCTKAMRDKLVADEEFAEDFAKVCLLVNVGRINTTLAFYPEMKTILRSYHPLPSLQRTENTRRNLQDAPRMKSLLKSVLLEDEKPGQPGSSTATRALASRTAKGGDGEKEEVPSNIPDLVRHLERDSPMPPTSAVNLLFILSAHSSEINAIHFEKPHDLFTLFFPSPEIAVPSRQRAQVFLWLMWHYLEGGVLLPPGSHPNPYDDEHSRESTLEARKAWDGLSTEEQSKIRAQGYWKGTKNPAYTEYKKQRAAQLARDGAWQDPDAPVEEAPPEYLCRILCPKLDSISFEQSAKENVDTPEEVEWAAQMKEERRQFLIRFQEEEQAKIQESRDAGIDVGQDGMASSSSGKRKGKDKVSKKRTTHIGGGSSYPLANILAAANAEKAAAAAKLAEERGDSASRKTKRKRGEDGEGESAESDEEEEDGEDAGDALWELDLSLPASLAPRTGVLRHINADTSDGTSKRSLSSQNSLPRIAWRRILERAQRGVGDASYESDDEEVARDEARDERPRAELARILACLREVRTHRGHIARPEAASVLEE